jgi:SAM-dependent methyltransferase
MFVGIASVGRRPRGANLNTLNDVLTRRRYGIPMTDDRPSVRWGRALEAWAIPDEILERAPESPYRLPPGLFARHRTHPDSRSRRRAVESLPEKGSVVDVGVGAGAASLALVPRAGYITGVDESPEMLDAFVAAAKDAGVEHAAVSGTWPDVADEVPIADVAVCHHVFYNVPDLVPFVIALTEAARHRVVVELTGTHPLTAMNKWWRHFHGLDRPTGPDSHLAAEVVREAGATVSIEDYERPSRWLHAERSDLVAFIRTRLCLTSDHDAEIDRLLEEADIRAPRSVTTLWWDGSAR